MIMGKRTYHAQHICNSRRILDKDGKVIIKFLVVKVASPWATRAVNFRAQHCGGTDSVLFRVNKVLTCKANVPLTGFKTILGLENP